MPEIYDLLQHLGELLIRDANAETRDQCSLLLVKFLITFPLSEKRRKQHIEFLINNISFEYAAGRKTVLITIERLFEEFSEVQVEKYGQVLFLPLVVQLVNEIDPTTLPLIRSLIKTLFLRSNPSFYMDSTLVWLKSENDLLVLAASMVLPVAIQSMENSFQKYAAHIFELVTTYILREKNKMDENVIGNVEIDEPHLLLNCLSVLENMFISLFAITEREFVKHAVYF